MFSKLRLFGAGILLAIIAWLKISSEKSKADAEKARADLEAASAAGAEAQLAQLNKAQAATRDAGVVGQQEIDDVKKNVDRGDLGGMGNNF